MHNISERVHYIYQFSTTEGCQMKAVVKRWNVAQSNIKWSQLFDLHFYCQRNYLNKKKYTFDRE